MDVGRTHTPRGRAEWRRWLERNHGRAREIWVVYHKKHSGRPRVSYNDAVEEALCFGWIDSIVKPIDAHRYAQRFSPRRRGSKLSPMNRERVMRLIEAGRMTAAGLAALQGQLVEGARPRAPALAPDIRRALAADPTARRNYRAFPASYKRIRIGWIEGARRRPEAFEQRLRYFVKMTAQNKRFGMVQ